jgi:hypothetical protein
MTSHLREAANGRPGWSISGENAATYAPGRGMARVDPEQ